jgi:CheY-like chemotaxis protein
MDIKEIVSNIPSDLSKLIKNIYVINKDDNTLYSINYKGHKTTIGPKKEYKEINNLLRDYKETPVQILSNEKGKYETENNGEDFIVVSTIDSYKIVYIIPLVSDSLSGDKKKIIVADDSPVVTNFLYKIFKDDYDVLIAHNGDETIKLLEDNNKEEIAACFTDLKMPISSGYKVLDYFKKNDLFKVIPVSVISGEDDVDIVSKITIEYDIVDLLQKPFSKDAAKNIVTKTINFKK